MAALRSINDVVKPWGELNALLAERLALAPKLSDVTRLAGALAVAIRHQVDTAGPKDSVVNAEYFEHRVILDTADFWKHGALRRADRNAHFSIEALFEYEDGRRFSFLRNALFVEHASFGKHDFLQTSLMAIYYWIRKHGFGIPWQGAVHERPAEFYEEAFLKYESEKRISVSQVHLSFFSRKADGSLGRVDPRQVRFAIH